MPARGSTRGDGDTGSCVVLLPVDHCVVKRALSFEGPRGAEDFEAGAATLGGVSVSAAKETEGRSMAVPASHARRVFIVFRPCVAASIPRVHCGWATAIGSHYENLRRHCKKQWFTMHVFPICSS